MPSLVGLRFHPPPGRPKTLRFFCLSVCLSRLSERLALNSLIYADLLLRNYSLTHLNVVGVCHVAPVVLREFYYLFTLKIVVCNCTQSHTTAT